MTVKILLVDDDPQIMDWLSLDLKLSGFSIDTATDGAQGLQKAMQNSYDLLILDVMMPKMDGFEVVKNLRRFQNTKDTPIILLTAKGTIEDKMIGFNSGADDYLVKPFDIQELLMRIRALLRRSKKEVSQSDEILEAGDIKLYTDSLEVKIKDEIKKLTPTEFELLYCLMQHMNKAVSLPTLLNEVWGYDADEDVRMVRVHMGGLRQKVEENTRHPKYILTVTNVGYKLVPWPNED